MDLSPAPADTRIIHCGDCMDQLRRLPDECVDLIYIAPADDAVLCDAWNVLAYKGLY